MKITLESVQGDIANQPDLAAIVNAANANLVTGGGVAGAIHRKAGPRLQEESFRLGPIRPGQAVITKAYNLANSYVIHCLGPVYRRDKPEDKILADCYKNALLLAEENRIESIGFPAISTGAFGYPRLAAAKVAWQAVNQTLSGLKNLRKIRFILHSREDLSLYQKLRDGPDF